MLSFVDFYRPTYFLLENVGGFLSFRSEEKLQRDGKPLKRVVKTSCTKFIMRTMIALGCVATTSLGAHTDADIVSRYQIHFRILNAVHYGSPQRRRRIVFLASRQGYPLPAFPIPTHTAIKDAHKYSLPTGDYVYPIVRHRPHSNLTDKTVHYQMAPCQGVTVENAISDLVRSTFILVSF